ncbi:uncharacterized protein DSM5745_08591 [Aspergillus mulundensis]|uniref:ABM domain-containing protein n=1 Tax=Aspergillus mulundensis TaxID=1810919 RepID=A0A3D8R4I1_9EURO|nr:Uncharacterized protein DSM5745_08591 [Aspergillus mulundensis]RDW68831.1 Uncharacterized protein DSM5745_08591 [Aspergillus mulundensis]
MPVTELACLHLKNNLPLTHPTNASLYTALRAGITAQAEYTNAKTSLLSQIEEPSYIYIVGRWASVAQHMEEWVPSSKNQEIMAALGDGIEVVWVQHLALDDSQTRGQDEGIPYSDAVVGIGRYFVASENKDGFERDFTETRHHLETFKRQRDIAWGWSVDRDEEFVLFSGWEAVDEHFSFADSEGFKEFSRIRDVMLSAEIKHARWEFTL